MRIVTAAQRRAALVARHHLAGDAADVLAATRSVVALHATDPASVYLSVLARCAGCGLDDVAAQLYDRRSLVRWLAMRRTLFVFERADVPAVHAAVSRPLATRLRTQLINRIRRNGTDPPVDGSIADWLDTACLDTERALRTRGTAAGTQLAADVPQLRTSIAARTASERPQRVTTSLLTLLGAQGRIVRGAPTGAWTNRQHLWEPVDRWWRDGVPEIDPDRARAVLARRWLERFGPATVEDLQWWTGWNKTTTRSALSAVPVDDVDLHGRPGVALRTAEDPVPAQEPVAALLPALDPTPMGWRRREWFFDLDPRQVFDTAGNIGPTVWWDGRIIGSWAVVGNGEIRTALVGDHGSQAAAAVQTRAEQLQRRLGGAAVTPAVRTPLERGMRAD